MQFMCHRLDRPETSHFVESDDIETAPDEYASRYVKMVSGDVTFVHVTRVDLASFVKYVPTMKIFRTICVRPGMYWTNEVTEEQARAEIAGVVPRMSRELRAAKANGPKTRVI